MPALPTSLSLTSILDGSPIIASDHRNNYAAIQTDVNALITALSGGTLGQFLQATSATAVQWAGGYTTYTPSWTATGTAPAIGNGTLTGRYVQIGKLVHFTAQFGAGSTTTFGTGSYTFSLPVTGAAATNTPLGPAFANDNSAGAISSALAIYATSTTFNIQYPATWPTGTQTGYGQTTPWTWATSDFIFVSGTYEAA